MIGAAVIKPDLLLAAIGDLVPGDKKVDIAHV
jgi:hypothetical protein